MSGELVPERSGMRASHEDREQVVEHLRVAAGDGRLTAEELDERLERALTARTYGELDALLTDLPAAPGLAPAVGAPAGPPVPRDVVAVKSRGGSVRREGPWTVPRRMEVDTRGGNVVLDFTRALITAPAMELAIETTGGNVVLVVPPGVAVDVGSMSIRGGNVRQRVHHEPGTPLTLTVGVSGSMRGGNLIVRAPRAPGEGGGFWRRLLRRIAGRQAGRSAP